MSVINERDYEYIGWVPCISGRLFYEFTECKLSKHRTPLIDINYTESISTNKYLNTILASSIVDWRDDDDEDLDGEYLVTLISLSELGSENISGKVYVYPNINTSSNIPDIKEDLDNINSHSLRRENISEAVNNLIESLDACDDSELYKAEFTLTKPGFVYLKLNNNEITDDHSKKVIIRQCYYYIKFLFHKHQHHDQNCDSLTTTHKLNAIPKDKIATRLLDDLRKSLVLLKRDFYATEYRTLLDSKGITSYALSLVESCYVRGYISEENYRSEKSYFSNIATSLNVKSDTIKDSRDEKNKISDNARAIILFLFSIVAPITIVYREKIKEIILNSNEAGDPIIVNVLARIIGSDHGLFFFLLIMVGFYWTYRLVYTTAAKKVMSFSFVKKIIMPIVFDHGKAFILSISFYIIIVLCMALIIVSGYYIIM